METNQDFSAQLVRLRSITKLGMIHEAHKQQLLLSPYAVDPSIDSVEIDISFDAKVVYYRWTNKQPMVIDSNYKYRLKELDKSIKFMFGSEWRMEVERNEQGLSWADAPAELKPTRARKQTKGKPRKRKNTKRKLTKRR